MFMGRRSLGRLGCLLAIATAVVLWQAGTASAQALPDSLAGKYTGTATSPNGDLALTAELKIVGGKLTGTVDSPQGPITITSGTLTDGKLLLNTDMGGVTGTISGKFADGRMTGDWTMGDMSGACTLTKVTADAAKPAPAVDAKAASATDAKPAATPADPVSGVWDGVAGSDDMSTPFVLTLKLEGDKVSGDISSDQGGGPLIPGTWKDGSLMVTFLFQQMGANVTVTGVMKDGKFTGSMDFAGQMQLTWAAVKR